MNRNGYVKSLEIIIGIMMLSYIYLYLQMSCTLNIFSYRGGKGQAVTEITLDPAVVKAVAFRRCLEFLYTGIVDLPKDSEHLDDTVAAAGIFNLPELQIICENASKGDEFLNPSIGTWLNDRNSAVAKQLFLNRELFSDIRFRVDGETVFAHKLVLCTRCEVMAAMLSGGFMESENSEVCDNFLIC